MTGEFDLIRRYCLPLADVVSRPWVTLGTGDDCAVLQPPPGRQLVVSTDNLVAGRHFLPDMNPADIGWRALAVSVSDLAAMGAEPAFFTCSLTLPEADENWIRGFTEGLADGMRSFGIPIVGGNLTRGPLNICMTVHGWSAIDAFLTRGGALPGDVLVVSGRLGAAAAGLESLRSGASAGVRAGWVARYCRPEPRLTLGRLLCGVASAAIDVSDGLLGDLAHIAAASGVALEVRAEALPLIEYEAAGLAAGQAQDWALAGGDDYELCFTVKESMRNRLPQIAAETGVPLTEIGRAVTGGGVWLIDTAGNRTLQDDSGYQHF